jgi:ribose-phosphate pyrophosphokinase
MQHIRENFDPAKLCLCSPDFGGLKRIKSYKNALHCDMAVIHKERLRPNQVESMEIIGDVQGKDVVIVDDMIDTGGTLCKAAELLIEKGASSVHAYCTHGVLSGNAVERIGQSVISSLVISDSIPVDRQWRNMQIISCDKLLVAAINHLLQNKSVKAISKF